MFVYNINMRAHKDFEKGKLITSYQISHCPNGINWGFKLYLLQRKRPLSSIEEKNLSKDDQ